MRKNAVGFAQGQKIPRRLSPVPVVSFRPERDRVLGEEYLRVKEEMNARGVLNSSMTIQSAHKAMAKEFETDRQLISDTIIDYVGKTQRVTSASLFQDIEQAELANRKSAIKNLFASGSKSIISGLQNSSMITPFVNLNDAFPLAQKELSIELNNALVAYNRSFDAEI
jgi:hypothetical protein